MRLEQFLSIKLEGPVGLEPTTFCLRGRRSNQLSYGPRLIDKNC